MNNKIVIGAVVGLIAGLVLGVFVGVLFISPSGILPINAGTGTNNQVQVSGSIQEENPSKIAFSSYAGIGSNENGKIQTSSLITNGQYSVVLVGNQSYAVIVIYQPNDGIYSSTSNSYSIYIPSGVTTFTANF